MSYIAYCKLETVKQGVICLLYTSVVVVVVEKNNSNKSSDANKQRGRSLRYTGILGTNIARWIQT